MDGRHTPGPGAGAIRAAEIIAGCKSGDDKRYMTTRGPKTVRGLAAIIDDTTAATELLAACKLAEECTHKVPEGMTLNEAAQMVRAKLRDAIRKAEGGGA